MNSAANRAATKPEHSTGLIHLLHRYYDPTTARFLSVDPMVTQTQAPYAYAQDSPVNLSDASGLNPQYTVCPAGLDQQGNTSSCSFYLEEASGAFGIQCTMNADMCPFGDPNAAGPTLAELASLGSIGVCLIRNLYLCGIATASALLARVTQRTLDDGASCSLGANAADVLQTTGGFLLMGVPSALGEDGLNPKVRMLLKTKGALPDAIGLAGDLANKAGGSSCRCER